MILPVVTIRPEPGCAATVAQGRALGLEVAGEPLSEIRPREWDAVGPDAVDALLIGSANALRHAGSQLGELQSKPVYAVGEATAEAAREAGWIVARVGTGGLQGLLDAVVTPQRLLRLAGEERVPLAVPDGIEVTTRVVYAVEPLPMPAALAERLRAGAVLLLHSAASARHFAAEVDRLAVPRSAVALGVLGPRIAAAAGGGWRAVCSAGEPTEAALLALAADLCHVSPGREGR